ncbi:MAG: sugar phosphate isomerase/epimerase family protein, partial [Candidatus Sumerlaeota bacterium]
MKLSQVAAITSSVSKYMKDDIPAGLKTIRDIGYQAVQLSCIGDFDPTEVGQACKDLGLTVCATHEPVANIFGDIDKVIEKHRILETHYVGYPYPHIEPESMDDVLKIAEDLNKAGKTFSEAGLKMVYHNHDLEFQRFDGRVALEVIYENTDPEYLLGEPDTYWIQNGGACVVDWMEKLKGRMPVLHMKDYGMVGKNENAIF